MALYSQPDLTNDDAAPSLLLFAGHIRKQKPLRPAEEEIEKQSHDSDHDNAGHDLVNLQEALAPHHHRANAGGRRYDLGDNEIGPTDRQHLPHGYQDLWSNGRQH